MDDSIQPAVEQVLAIEREANAVVERARTEAREIRARGSQEADAVREKVLAEAHREADLIVATARAEAAQERDRRLADTARELEELERSAQQKLDVAVQFVVARLLGELATEPKAGGVPSS